MLAMHFESCINLQIKLLICQLIFQTSASEILHMQQRTNDLIHRYNAKTSCTSKKSQDGGRKFILKCPKFQEVISNIKNIKVDWKHDNITWLTIRNGNIIQALKAAAFERKAGKTIIKLRTNDGRYTFHYDISGKNFFMQIHPIVTTIDVGSWMCKMIIQTSNSRRIYKSKKAIKLSDLKCITFSSDKAVNGSLIYERNVHNQINTASETSCGQQLPYYVIKKNKNRMETITFHRNRPKEIYIDKEMPSFLLPSSSYLSSETIDENYHLSSAMHNYQTINRHSILISILPAFSLMYNHT